MRKGGISRTAPPELAPGLHSLPPILHIPIPMAVPSCSKGPRGLSVFPRVGGIFTSTTISPDPWSRQPPSRYAIHAGRYLTDKEFRYLRTVIVTAAVHRGFGSEPRPLPLTFRHRASVAPYTSTYVFAESCVFGKQSPEPVHCGCLGLITLRAAPLLPKLRGHFAEFLSEGSLARLSALAPAHLCRFTVRALHLHRLEAFLGSLASAGYHPYGLPRGRRACRGRICLPSAPRTAAGLVHGSGPPSLKRPPIAPVEWGRNINRLSIGFPSRVRLRSRLTLRRRPLRRNPWAYGEGDSHPLYRYLCLHSHFPYLQSPSRSTFVGMGNALLPRSGHPAAPAASVLDLSPDHFRREGTRPVSYYALFKGWLLLSQPPGYLSERTTFCQLSLHLGALAGGLGCSPLGTGP